MDQHHPEVGGEVAGEVVPLEGSVQEPDLGVGRCEVHMEVSCLVNLGPVRPGRKDQADFPGPLTAVQLEYLPAETELGLLELTRLRHSVRHRRGPLVLGEAAVHGLDVQQGWLLRVEVVAEPAHPPEVGHPVERHVAQGQQLAGVVVVPGQAEAVTRQVEISDVLGKCSGKLVDRSTWKYIIIYPSLSSNYQRKSNSIQN